MPLVPNDCSVVHKCSHIIHHVLPQKFKLKLKVWIWIVLQNLIALIYFIRKCFVGSYLFDHLILHLELYYFFKLRDVGGCRPH